MVPRPKELVRRVLVRALVGLGWMVVTLAAGVAFLLLAVQFDPVGRAVLMRAAAVATPRWLDLEVDEVSGSWVRSLVVSGLRARDRRSGDFLSADTLTLTYRPLRWRPGRLVLDDVDVSGAALRASRPAETASRKQAPDRSTPSELEGGWTFAVGAFSLRKAEGTLIGPGGGRFHAGPLDLTVADVRLGRELRVASWELKARFAPAERPTGWGELHGEGSITRGTLVLDSVSIRTARSVVAGSGQVPLENPLGHTDQVHWTLVANPLALGDLEGLVAAPAVLGEEALSVTSTAQGSEDTVDIGLQARSSGGGRLDATVRLTRQGPTWSGRLTSMLTGVDPRRYLREGAPQGPLSGHVQASGELTSEGGATAISASARVRGSAPDLAFAGDVIVRRRGAAAGAFRDSVAVLLDSLNLDRVELGAGSMTVVGSEGKFDWELEGHSGTRGVIAGAGTLGLADDAPPRLVGRLVFDSLVEPYSTSILDGQLEWKSSGSRLRGADGSLRLVLGPSRLGGADVDSASFALSWSRGSGRFRGGATSPHGRASWEGSASVSEDGGEVRLSRMEVDSLTPVATVDHPGSAGDGAAPAPPFLVSGRLAGRVGWRGAPATVMDPTRVRGTLTFTDRGSRFGAFEPVKADIRLDWSRGTVGLEAQAALPDSGRVEVAAAGTVLDSLALAIRRGRFRNVDLAGLFASSPSTDLSGTIEGSVRGSSEGGFVSSLAIRTDPSRVGLDTVRVLDASLELRPDTVQADLRAELGGGRVRGRLGARPRVPRREDDQPERRREASTGEAIGAWQIDLDADLPRLGAFFGRPDSSVALQARGRASGGGESDSTRWNLVVPRATAWGAQVDSAFTSGSLSSTVLRVDTILVRSNLLTADGGGELSTAGIWRGPDLLDTVPVTDTATRLFALQVELIDTVTVFRPLEDLPLVARKGSLSVGTECGPDGCSLDGVLEMGSVVVDRYSVAASRVEVDGALAPGPSVRHATADVSIQGIRTPSAGIRNADASISYDGEIVDLDASTVIDRQRDATLGLVLDPRVDRRMVTIREARFRMDEDQWRLRRPTTLWYGNGGVAVDTLELSADRQRIQVQGAWGGGRGHDFTVLLDSVRVGTVSDLAGAPGLDGWIDATVDGHGEGDAPLFEAEASGELTYRGQALNRFHVRADRGNEHLTVDAQLTDSLERRRLQIVGDIPAGADRPGDWDLRVRADSVPVRWVQPYLDTDVARGLDGNLGARLRIHGSRMAPLAEGPLEVDRGRVTLPAAGITLSEVSLRSRVRERTLELDTVRARSGGVIRGAGVLTLPSLDDPVGIDLGFSARSFQVANTPLVRATVDGEVDLTGDTRMPRVTGTLDVVEADIRMSRGLGGADVEDVALTATDWATLQARFGIPAPQEAEAPTHAFQATELDLSVKLGRNIWLRQDVNPELAVQFTGDVAVRKPAESDAVRLRGRLDALPSRSYMEQFGRRFQLEEGSVQLRGAPKETHVQLTSVYEVPPRNGDASAVDIRLSLSGEVGNLSLTLSSDPPMENVDIVSYLATGRPASSALSGGGEGDGTSFTELGTEVVASRLTSLVERVAMQDVGLDVVEIQREGLEEATLVAGRYVTPELFLGFRQPVSFGRTDDGPTGPGASEAEIEWKAFRWLLLNLETGGQAFRFFLEGSLGF